jgi:hypothetical protein
LLVVVIGSGGDDGIGVVTITFMQGVYNYIPETNHVSKVYSFAAILYLQSATHNGIPPMKYVLYFKLALSIVCMQFPIQLFFAVPKFCAFYCNNNNNYYYY